MMRSTLLVGLCCALSFPAAADHRATTVGFDHFCKTTTSLVPCTLTGRTDVFGIQPTADNRLADSVSGDASTGRSGRTGQIRLAQSDEAPKDLKAALQEYINELLGIKKAPKKPAETPAPASAAKAKPETPITQPSQAEIEGALSKLLAERESWGTAPAATASGEPPVAADSASSLSGAADIMAGATGDLAKFISTRESWGMSEPKDVNAPLAKGAVTPLPKPETRVAPADNSAEPIIHQAEKRPLPEVNEPAQASIQTALADLLGERTSWGTAPAMHEASASTAASPADVTAQVTGDLAGFLVLRESWSTGPEPRAIKSPLAKGAPKSFAPDTKPTFIAGPTPETIVHALEERPLPKLSLISQADIVRARNALLEERASWGVKPSKSTASATSDLAAYIARREGWGTGPEAKLVKAPLAKGATLELNVAAETATESTGSPIVHEAEDRPLPQIAEIAPAKVAGALKDLLATREGWGAEPSQSKTSSALDLNAYFARRESWGTGPEAKPVAAPLAKGATQKLKLATTPAPAPEGPAPIVHEANERPLPKVAEIAPDKVAGALKGLLATREGWGMEPSRAETSSALDLDAYLARRQSWGTGPEAKPVAAPLAKGATRDFSLAAGYTTERDGGPVVSAAGTPTPAGVKGTATDDISSALQMLLATRESWGTEPHYKEPVHAGDLGAYLARRDRWGTGPKVKTVKAPLAKGAPRKLKLAAAPAPAPEGPDPIVHEAADRPLPQVADIAPDMVAGNLKDLLETRESWGTQPSLSGARFAGDLDRYFARRQAWGTGPKAKRVRAPLAKGARRKLRLAKAPASSRDGKPPIVHEAEDRPLPQVADIAPDKVAGNLKDLLETRESWGTEPHYKEPVHAGDLGAYLARRDRWGTGPKVKTVKAPLAKGAPRKLKLAAAPTQDPNAADPIVHEAEDRPLPQVADIAPDMVAGNLKDLLETRESWGTEPHYKEPVHAGDLGAYLARRDRWGTGPKVKTVKAPLAKGAPRKLKLAAAPTATPEGPDPIVHEAADRPLPQVADIAPDMVAGNLKDLLETRESWGTQPSLSGARFAGDLDRYFARRQAWGTGPKAKRVRAPLAKGARRKLRLAKAPASSRDGKPPIVHEAEDRPLPQVTPISQDILSNELQALLEHRAGWGLVPSKAQPSAIVTGSTETGDEITLESYLARRDNWQTGATSEQAETTVAAATEDGALTVARCKDDLDKLAARRNILFARSSAELSGSSSELLDEIAELIKACGTVSVRVEGHTDSIGATEQNQALSEARATSVLEYLVNAGIDRSRLEAIGYGESKPIASNATSRSRALNRRIEFSIQ